MTEISITTADGKVWSAAELAAAVQAVNALKDAEKTAREAEAAELKVKFDALAPQLTTLTREVAKTHKLQTWFRRDRATKQKTDVVSKVGYVATGVMAVETPDGRLHEARVTVSIGWKPGGGAPAVETDSED